MPVLTIGRNKPAQRPRAFFGRKAITAAAERAQDSPGGLLRLDQKWQREAMRIYRTVGECWNPAQYYSRAMERIRYYPAIRDERGVPVEVTDGPLVDLFKRIQSPSGAPGDLTELAGAYARLQFVIGDGMLTVSEDEGGEVWEYLSPMELRMQPRDATRPQEYRRHRAPGVTPDELTEAPDDQFVALRGDRVHVWRLWRRHPEYSQWSDSPVRPVIELYELLNRLTLAVGAEATSRAAQRGLLFVPSEFSYGPVDTTQEENPDEDPIIKELTDSMSRAIRNPGTAEAAQPFVFRAPGVTSVGGGQMPTADLIKWISLTSGDRYVEGEMWDRTISRIAGSIDMPKELMTGVGDVSHWGQWFLDDIGFRQHTGPTVIRFCNDMAAAYLRPAAKDEGIPDAEQVVVWFDASQAINHPDETGVARDAHDRLVVSDQFYREKIGATDTDAPPPAELKRRTEIKLKEDPYTVGQKPVPQQGQTSPPSGGRGGDVVQEPPTDSQQRPPGSKPPSPAGPSLAAMIVGAAEMQIVRARELAGNRLWRRAQSCDECRETAKNVAPALIAAALGPDTVRSVIEGHATEASLVDGVGIAFADLVRELGIDKGWPEQLGKMVEQHALRTLYEHDVPRVPTGFWSAAQRASGETD